MSIIDSISSSAKVVSCGRRALTIVGPKFLVLPAKRGFVVVDQWNVEVGSYLSRKGAEAAALRLNASVARAKLFGDRKQILEGPSDDAPHSADISADTSRALDEEGISGQMQADYLLMTYGPEEAADHDRFEEAEWGDFMARRPELASIDCYA